jgi:hypothetical protein
MASGFGYVKRPQSPAPDPRAVGQAMAARRAPPALPGAAAMADTSDTSDTSGQPLATARGDAAEDALRVQAGMHTGGAGQTGTGSAPAGEPNYPVDETADHSARNAAIGAALTRLGGGVMRNPDLSPLRAARRQAHLAALGITPFEIELLSRSGGI